MGVSIPGVTGLLNQPTGQVIDGSLKFDSVNKNRIDRTATSGSGTTWTLSLWVNKQNNDCHVFGAGAGNTPGRFGFGFNGSDKIFAFVIDSGSTVFSITTDAVFRDIGWYHIVLVADTTNGTQANRFEVYVNGVLQTVSGTLMPASQDTFVNSSATHTFGRRSYTDSDHFSGQITNAYLIDGQALDESYFGFTDPLTNTWRPKKYTGDFSYALTAPTYDSGGGSDVTTTEFAKMVDGDLSTYGQGTGASGTNRFIGFSLSTTEYPTINIKIKNTTGSALDFFIQPDEGSGYTNGGTFASSGSNSVNVAGGVTHEDTYTFPSNYSGTGRIYLNNSGNAADAWEIYDFGGTKVTTNSFYLPFDGNSPIGQDKSGKGNNWTPVNFGNSLPLDNPSVSGARPILNTTQGGTQAGVGVFGSKEGFYETVSSSSGGGNPYIFDDRGTQPTLSFIRGATYVFDYSSATSHPLRFATAADAAGSTEYTDGTSVSGNVISFTVPHNAPDTLYYYCTNHSGMGNSISVTTDETKADPYAWKCVTALPLAGGVGDLSGDLNCTTTSKTWTANDATPSNLSNFYNGSFNFDGTGDNVESADNADYAFGTGDITIEMWVYLDVLRGTLWDSGAVNGNNNCAVFIDGTYLYWYMKPGNDLGVSHANSGLKTGRWNHLAFVRSGSTAKMYLNGQEIESDTNASNVTAEKAKIGTLTGYSQYDLGGQVQDVRVYKGVAKYTSNFTPASIDSDILPDTPSGVSGSSKLAKITDGAVTFDGTGDYLVVADDDDFDLGTGDFTFEAFFNQTSSYTNYRYIFSHYDGSNGHWLRTDGDGPGRVQFGAGGTVYITSTSKVALNRWHHVAVVRVGTTVTLYLDGKSEGTYTLSGDITSTGEFRIGRQGGSTTHYFGGFISNVRINKGSSLYTSNFTPPTAPLTNVTNTKLLCCQSNTSAAIAAVTPNVPGSGINDGTIWSANVSASTGSIVDAGLGFDGSTSTAAYASSSASDTYIYIDFSTALSGTFKLWTGMASGSPTATVTHSGGSSSVSLSSGENSLGTFTSVTRIAVNRGEAATHSFQAIAVDDVQLLDPVAVAGDAAATNFNPFITDINTVRGQETGYPTWNPLDQGPGVTLSKGNLSASVNGGTNNSGVRATMILPKSGKYFFAIEMNVIDDASDTFAGLMYMRQAETVRDLDAGGTRLIVRGSGSIINDSTSTGLTAFSAGDQLGVAVDCDANTVQFYRNSLIHGVAQTPSVSITEDWAPWCGTSSGTSVFVINTGQKPFKFPPPDGFQPLNAANARPETVIARPDQYVGITTWKGDDQASHVINDLNFDGVPDFVWIKRIDGNDMSHQLYDTIRGATKPLVTSSTAGEDTQTSGLIDFVRNGFELGASSVVNGLDGDNGNVPFNYVAWCWKAGGNKNTFNVDDVGYANASDVSMDVGGIRAAVAVSSGNDYSAGYAGHSPVGTWVDSDSWSGLPAYSSGQKGYFSGTETLSNGSVISAAANPKPFNAVVNGSQGFVLRASTTVTLRLLVQSNVTEIATTSSDSQTFGNRTIVATNPTSGTYVEATGKCFWWSGNSNLPSISIMGTLYDAPAQPSIAPTGCSVGTKQGFSILKWTGTSGNGTLSHGLTEAPNFVIVKANYSPANWNCYHSGLTDATKYIWLNFTNGENTQTAAWNSTAPTSNLFHVGGEAEVNRNGFTSIAYLWHDVPGLQKFGTYVGNENTSGLGPFVELGFRPAIIWIKNIDQGTSAADWVIYDSERNKFNPSGKQLYPNRNIAEADDSNHQFDLLSNGFRVRSTSTSDLTNATDTYIYCAWAEAPTFNLYGGQANAR